MSKERQVKMLSDRRTIPYGAILIFLFVMGASLSGSQEWTASEKQQYTQDLAGIEALQKALRPGPVNNLEEYKKAADGIQEKWRSKNREAFGRLMLEVCGPLSSGAFPDDKRFALARSYALSALAEPNSIPLELELRLIGQVMTQTTKSLAPVGQDLTGRRREDIEVRLQAWRRLIASVDPDWNPNEMPLSPNAVGADLGIPVGGMAPENIKDRDLRVKYEAALRENEEEIEKYGEQYQLHKWLTWYPKTAEDYIIQLYSQPPFDADELAKYLSQYGIPQQAKTRILNDVARNMQKRTEEASPDHAPD